MKKAHAFSIVELLVVIVIIGILAAITVVFYTGISNKAIAASLESDLQNGSKILKLYYVDHGLYPTSLDPNNCPVPVDTKYCIKASQGNTISYSSLGNNTHYNLAATHNPLAYFVSDTSTISQVATAESFAVAVGGVGFDFGFYAIPVTDGSIVFGNTMSYGAGSFDGVLAKFDSSGNLIWNKTWGGTGNDQFRYGKTTDNGYIVTGFTSGYGAGGLDALLLKFDSSGNLVWNKTWGGSGTDVGAEVLKTSDGGYIVSGQTGSYGTGSNDGILAKFDSSANLVWNKTWGGTGDDIFGRVTSTSDGGYIVTGYAKSYGAGSNDGMLAKFDSSGNLVWNKTWGGTGYEYISGVLQTDDNNFIVIGQTGSYGAGGADCLLAKFDSSGNLVWNKTWGGTGDDIARGIIQDSDGGFIINSDTTSFGAGSYDLLLSKFDSSGNLVWNKTWGGSGLDGSSSISRADDDSIIATLQSDSYGAGSYDMLLLKFKSDGTMNNCSSPMCQTPTATVATPSATVTTPSATVTTPSATVTTPSVTLNSISPTFTTIVSP